MCSGSSEYEKNKIGLLFSTKTISGKLQVDLLPFPFPLPKGDPIKPSMILVMLSTWSFRRPIPELPERMLFPLLFKSAPIIQLFTYHSH